MELLGIEINRPSSKGLLTTLTMTAIGVLSGLLLIHVEHGNYETVVTLGSAAFSGSLAYEIGLDTKKHGARALALLVAFVLTVNTVSIYAFRAMGLHF